MMRTPPWGGRGNFFTSRVSPSTVAVAWKVLPARRPSKLAQPSGPVVATFLRDSPPGMTTMAVTSTPGTPLMGICFETRTLTVPSGSWGAGRGRPTIARMSPIWAWAGAASSRASSSRRLTPRPPA
jgi:hypothetical protein